YLSGPSTMGLCYFPWAEVVSPHAMGLYSTSGTPSPTLAEMQRFPTRSNAAAVDVVRRRSSPVVLDDFHRPNSASSVGTSPLGGTPTATTLTFGITSRQLYVASGSAVGYLTWACNTGNVDIELEFLSPSGVYNIGIVSRFINSSNYYYVNFHAQTI